MGLPHHNPGTHACLASPLLNYSIWRGHPAFLSCVVPGHVSGTSFLHFCNLLQSNGSGSPGFWTWICTSSVTNESRISFSFSSWSISTCFGNWATWESQPDWKCYSERIPRSPPEADGVSERTTIKWIDSLHFEDSLQLAAGNFNVWLEIFCDPAHFFALFHFVFLDHCSEDRPTFGGPDRNVALRPCGVLPEMWSWKSPVFLSHPTRLRCLLTLLLTQIIPTHIGSIFVCIDS